MTKTEILCDFCGKSAKSVRYDFLKHEWECVGYGYTPVDLCHEHAIFALQEFLQKPKAATMESARQEFSRWAKQAAWKPKS